MAYEYACHRGHNISELFNHLPKLYFAARQTERDY